MTTTFETAKVGDKVWSLLSGWGVIITMKPEDTYSLRVKFGTGRSNWYTMDGKNHSSNKNQTLFWDEVKIVAPHKSLPDFPADTKLFVWVKEGGIKYPRYFSHFDGKGRAVCFLDGQTSWTTIGFTTVWDYWELAE